MLQLGKSMHLKSCIEQGQENNRKQFRDSPKCVSARMEFMRVHHDSAKDESHLTNNCTGSSEWALHLLLSGAIHVSCSSWWACSSTLIMQYPEGQWINNDDTSYLAILCKALNYTFCVARMILSHLSVCIEQNYSSNYILISYSLDSVNSMIYEVSMHVLCSNTTAALWPKPDSPPDCLITSRESFEDMIKGWSWCYHAKIDEGALLRGS